MELPENIIAEIEKESVRISEFQELHNKFMRVLANHNEEDETNHAEYLIAEQEYRDALADHNKSANDLYVLVQPYIDKE